jgi:hypothetical protein
LTCRISASFKASRYNYVKCHGMTDDILTEVNGSRIEILFT